jgi:magnesium-transporting ATPase (P-type)
MGSGIILVGCQLALGYDRPLLPQRIDRLELSPDASQKLLNNIERQQIRAQNDRLATQELRVLGFAYRYFPHLPDADKAC